METTNLLDAYSAKKILITGGLGFIGSNLAHKLVALGAHVTILDNLAPLYGGNRFNISGIEAALSIVIGDLRDETLVQKLVVGKDIIFNLAAQVSHTDSGNIPYEDLDINCKGHLYLLESCRKYNPRAKVLFSSSRLVLGKILENPITETHPTNPLSMYGVHKLTAEKYYQLYHQQYGIDTTVLRITNPYGERQQMKHSKYSIPGWFMRLAIEGKTIEIFGGGKQLRDYVHIHDLVQAFLLTGVCTTTAGQLYNCGYGLSVAFRDMVEVILATVGNGSIVYIPWPPHYEKEETGDCEIDLAKLREAVGWQPQTTLLEGVKKMYDYYRVHEREYW